VPDRSGGAVEQGLRTHLGRPSAAWLRAASQPQPILATFQVIPVLGSFASHHNLQAAGGTNSHPSFPAKASCQGV
jgi:hypothetical protein